MKAPKSARWEQNCKQRQIWNAFDDLKADWWLLTNCVCSEISMWPGVTAWFFTTKGHTIFQHNIPKEKTVSMHLQRPILVSYQMSRQYNITWMNKNEFAKMCVKNNWFLVADCRISRHCSLTFCIQAYYEFMFIKVYKSNCKNRGFVASIRDFSFILQLFARDSIDFSTASADSAICSNAFRCHNIISTSR